MTSCLLNAPAAFCATIEWDVYNTSPDHTAYISRCDTIVPRKLERSF